jgi:hypothetical protein
MSGALVLPAAITGETHISPGIDGIIVELAAAIATHAFIADALVLQTVTLFADRDTSVTHGSDSLLPTNRKREE